MATLSPHGVTRAGYTPAPVAATAGGDAFTPGDDVFLHAKNSGGSAAVVTVLSPGNVRGLAIGGAAGGSQVTVPATTGELIWGPFPASVFAGATGLASITYTNPSGVTIEVLRCTAS